MMNSEMPGNDESKSLQAKWKCQLKKTMNIPNALMGVIKNQLINLEDWGN